MSDSCSEGRTGQPGDYERVPLDDDVGESGQGVNTQESTVVSIPPEDQDPQGSTVMASKNTTESNDMVPGPTGTDTDSSDKNMSSAPTNNHTLESKANPIKTNMQLAGHCLESRNEKMKMKKIVVAGILGVIIFIAIIVPVCKLHSPDDKNLASETNNTQEGKSQVNQNNVQLAETTCTDGWRKDRDSCYFNVTMDQETWKGSRDRCQEMGADLVNIGSKEEQEFVRGLVSGEAWIGLSWNGSNWTWPDGTPLTTPHWQDGFPVDGDNCAAQYEGNEGWNNVPCGYKRYWICEKSLK